MAPRCPTCGRRLPGFNKPRSTGPHSQNHHLNGHVAQIAEETGDDFRDVKDDIKERAIKRGYPFRTTKLGRVRPKHEPDTTMEECAMLIEEAHAVAAFLGITLREE